MALCWGAWSSYCACADPGQVNKTRKMKIGAVGGMDIEEGMLRRAHKPWQYSRPIRRYDHSCKWLKNVVGLLRRPMTFLSHLQ